MQKKADPREFYHSIYYWFPKIRQSIVRFWSKHKPNATFRVRLVMADRSVKQPVGILHDVLVKVDDFILSANFVVLY